MSVNPKVIQAILSNDKLTEEAKSELIADFLESLNKEFPELKHHATKDDVEKAKLELYKEVEQTRKEIKDTELKLTKEIKEIENKLTIEIENVRKDLTLEIENVRKEIKETDAKLSNQTKELELKLTKEIKEIEVSLKETKFTMLKWQFIFWVTQMGAIITIGYKLIH
ncbi:MAG: DUF1640 domain-containing protein [Epsilonproteobacteria bacterium]|nr:DUF1640 domain-containing protein [Campylobacterota bacterium]